MRQMEVDELDIVAIDYESPELPQSVRDFRPVLFHDGTAYCCLLGPDPHTGVFGCGITRQQAITDWERDYKTHLRVADQEDEVTRFLLDSNAVSKKEVW